MGVVVIIKILMLVASLVMMVFGMVGIHAEIQDKKVFGKADWLFLAAYWTVTIIVALGAARLWGTV